MTKLSAHVEYCDELARYIERASCAVGVLGDLLKAMPEEQLDSGATESLGCLMEMLSDAMRQRSLDGYDFVHRNRSAVSSG